MPRRRVTSFFWIALSPSTENWQIGRRKPFWDSCICVCYSFLFSFEYSIKLSDVITLESIQGSQYYVHNESRIVSIGQINIKVMKFDNVIKEKGKNRHSSPITRTEYALIYIGQVSAAVVIVLTLHTKLLSMIVCNCSVGTDQVPCLRRIRFQSFILGNCSGGEITNHCHQSMAEIQLRCTQRSVIVHFVSQWNCWWENIYEWYWGYNVKSY